MGRYGNFKPKAAKGNTGANEEVKIAHGKFFDDDGRITKQDPSVGLNEAGKVIKMEVDKKKQKENKKKHDELYHS